MSASSFLFYRTCKQLRLNFFRNFHLLKAKISSKYLQNWEPFRIAMAAVLKICSSLSIQFKSTRTLFALVSFVSCLQTAHAKLFLMPSLAELEIISQTFSKTRAMLDKTKKTICS